MGHFLGALLLLCGAAAGVGGSEGEEAGLGEMGPAAKANSFTLATKALSLTVTQAGVVTAVTDIASGRNLVLTAAGTSWPWGQPAAPQHAIVSAVFKSSKGRAATSPTKVEYDASHGLLTATFSQGAVIPVSINMTTDGFIIFTVLAAGAHVDGITDILFLTTPLQIQSSAYGPTAAFDGNNC